MKYTDNSLIRYQWFKDSPGYEWLTLKVRPHRYVEGPKGGKFVRGARHTKQEWIITQAYRGLHRPPALVYDAPPDLFHTFSKIGDTKEEIKKFADEYGLLGFERDKGAPLDFGGTIYFDDPVSGMDWPGELLTSWQGAIAQMRQAVALWLAILNARIGDAADLRRYVNWNPRWDGGRGYVAVHREPDGRSAGGRVWRGTEISAFKIGDLLGPAEEFLKEELTSHVAARLSRGFDRTNTPGESPRWITVFRPPDLRSLMWHQFADAFTGTGETKFRPCKRKGCPNLIRISVKGEGSRRQKVVCGNNCWVQISQERARTARALFDAGKNPEEIAKELGAKLMRVETWIGRALAERGQTARAIARRLRLGERVVHVMLERKHRLAPVKKQSEAFE